MANSLLFLSKPTCLLSTTSIKNPSIIPLQSSLFFNCTTHQHKPIRRGFPSAASVSSVSFPVINMEYLEREFGSHGVSFTKLGESFVVNMAVENGSGAKLMLPSGLITSYKPRLWHGGTQELLHTCVSEGGDGVVVQGGVSLALGCEGECGFSWSPSTWAFKDVRGNAVDGIQVEIVSRDPENEVEVQYNITLKEDSLSSDFTLSNLRSSTLEFRGSIVSHLTVSTPDATYAVGLEGSNFFDRPPVLSKFSIIPPDVTQNNDKLNIFQNLSLERLFPSHGTMEEAAAVNNEGEENNNYKHLTDKMSRIYTSAPRNFTIIDRGKRNSVDIGRNGFDELYVYSPGSAYEWYGEYAYVCVGQSVMLRPVQLGPGDVWRGEQQLHNPNI